MSQGTKAIFLEEDIAGKDLDKEKYGISDMGGQGKEAPRLILKQQNEWAKKEQTYINNVWQKVKTALRIPDGMLLNTNNNIAYDETTLIPTKFNRGGVVYAHDGFDPSKQKMPTLFDLPQDFRQTQKPYKPDVKPKPGLAGASIGAPGTVSPTQQQAIDKKVREQTPQDIPYWFGTRKESQTERQHRVIQSSLDEGTPEWYKNAGIAWQMVEDLGSGLAVKPNNPRLLYSPRGIKTPITKSPFSIPVPDYGRQQPPVVPKSKTPLPTPKQPVVSPTPRPEKVSLGFEYLGTRGAANPKAGGVKGTGLTSTDTQATAQVFDPSKTMSQSRTLAEYQKSLKDARDAEFKRLDKLQAQWAKEQLIEYQRQEKEGTLKPDYQQRSLKERAAEFARLRAEGHKQRVEADHISAQNSSKFDFDAKRTGDFSSGSFIKSQAKPTFSKFIPTKDFDIDSIQRLMQYPQPVFDSLVERVYQLTGTSGELPKTFNRTNLLFGDQEIGITGIGAAAPGIKQEPIGRMGFRDTIGRENIKNALIEVLLSNFRSEIDKFQPVNLGPVDEMNAREYKDRGLIGSAEQKVGGIYGTRVEGTGNFYHPESNSAAAKFLSTHTNFNLTQADTDPKLAQSRGGFLIETARGVLERAQQEVMTKLQQAVLAQQNKPQTPDVHGAPASNKIRIISPENSNSNTVNSEVLGEYGEIIAFYEDPKTGSANQAWGRVSAKPIDKKTYKIETSLAKKGHGESLYHAIIEYITKIGGSVIPDYPETQSPDAKKLWKKLEKHPDISGDRENGYTKKPSLITDPTRVGPGVSENYIRRPTNFDEIHQQGYGDLVKPVSPTPVTPIPSPRAKAFIQSKSRGGVVYASSGALIPYEPRGTNTVPAMLTPGEFVINRAATQKNLPLLKSINSGGSNYSSGGVVYAEDGTFIPWRNKYSQMQGEKENAYRKEQERKVQAYKEEQARRANEYQNRGSVRPSSPTAPPQQQNQQQNQYQMSPQTSQRVNMAAQAAFDPKNSGDVNKQLTIFGTLLTGTNQVLTQFGATLENMIKGMGASPVGGGVNNGSAGQQGSQNQNKNGPLDGLSDFTTKFGEFIGQLQKINLPPVINVMGNHKVEVIFNGAEILRELQPEISKLVVAQVGGAMKSISDQSEGAFKYQV